jgi:hypothetical protein
VGRANGSPSSRGRWGVTHQDGSICPSSKSSTEFCSLPASCTYCVGTECLSFPRHAWFLLNSSFLHVLHSLRFLDTGRCVEWRWSQWEGTQNNGRTIVVRLARHIIPLTYHSLDRVNGESGTTVVIFSLTSQLKRNILSFHNCGNHRQFCCSHPIVQGLPRYYILAQLLSFSPTVWCMRDAVFSSERGVFSFKWLQ